MRVKKYDKPLHPTKISQKSFRDIVHQNQTIYLGALKNLKNRFAQISQQVTNPL